MYYLSIYLSISAIDQLTTKIGIKQIDCWVQSLDNTLKQVYKEHLQKSFIYHEDLSLPPPPSLPVTSELIPPPLSSIKWVLFGVELWFCDPNLPYTVLPWGKGWLVCVIGIELEVDPVVMETGEVKDIVATGCGLDCGTTGCEKAAACGWEFSNCGLCWGREAWVSDGAIAGTMFKWWIGVIDGCWCMRWCLIVIVSSGRDRWWSWWELVDAWTVDDGVDVGWLAATKKRKRAPD